ncbi:hypothetical protein N4T77_01385 [Clostridium sp. CX1]|nr:hypothetical protein [Clostridium sp. CX1]MCT8975242.1 hypothetical protein [Clostridium sp. CX1]
MFNKNEWFVIALLAFYILVFLLPKRFPLFISIIFILYGIAVAGVTFDFILGGPTLDYYDDNNNSKYEIIDFLLYTSYGSFSYLIAYFFDKFKLKKQYVTLYVLALAIMSIGVEWIGHRLGVFHYKNGYKIEFSFPIYLMVYSILLILYFKLHREKN